ARSGRDAHGLLRRARPPLPARAGRGPERPPRRRRGGALRAPPAGGLRAARAGRGARDRAVLAVTARPVVLRALGLGDLLTALPALRALADAFPHHRRTLAAPAALRPLALLSGAVDELVDTAPLAPLAPSLHAADVAVNLHGRGPQSHALLRAARP